MSNEIAISKNNLPVNLSDLSKFVLIGREKLVAVGQASFYVLHWGDMQKKGYKVSTYCNQIDDCETSIRW